MYCICLKHGTTIVLQLFACSNVHLILTIYLKKLRQHALLTISDSGLVDCRPHTLFLTVPCLGSICWRSQWLNSSSIRWVSRGMSSSVFCDVQTLRFPTTLCLGMVSQLKLRILERRWALRENGSLPVMGGGGWGRGGGGGGGGGRAGLMDMVMPSIGNYGMDTQSRPTSAPNEWMSHRIQGSWFNKNSIQNLKNCQPVFRKAYTRTKDDVYTTMVDYTWWHRDCRQD